MITIELGNLYGMENEEELMRTIQRLKDMGVTDADIQKCLEHSDGKGEKTNAI